MGEGEAIYLTMVISAMALFAVSLFSIARKTNNRNR
jgi:hypothetical protein